MLYKENSYAHNSMLLYQKIRASDINDWYVELYMKMSFTITKGQLIKHEGEVIREIATLSKRIEGRTKKIL